LFEASTRWPSRCNRSSCSSSTPAAMPRVRSGRRAASPAPRPTAASCISGETTTARCAWRRSTDPTVGVEMQVWDCNFGTTNQQWDLAW